MGDVVEELTKKVAFGISKKNDHGENENWCIAENFLLGVGDINKYIEKCVSGIPASVMREGCDSSPINYAAQYTVSNNPF